MINGNDNKEKIDILNYLLTSKGKFPISRNYKIQIKDIGCNAQCPICDDWKNKGNKQKIILNLKLAFRHILKENIKFKRVQILGGEPLLIINEIVKIIKAGTILGIKFDFPTNASLLNIKNIDKLINAGLDNFTFSIDFTDDFHDKWRNLEGTYKKILDFTKYLKEKGVFVQWNTVIGKFNIDEIEKFDYLYKSVSPNIHSFIEIEETGGSSKINLLSSDDKKKILYNIKKLKNNNTNINIISNGFSEIFLDDKIKVNKCYIPIKLRSYIINEDGFKIFPCYHEFQNNFNIEDFTKKSIERGCNLCKSSYKYDYNDYMLNLIKKYKLSNK